MYTKEIIISGEEKVEKMKTFALKLVLQKNHLANGKFGNFNKE